jgi:hypothetical protein
VAVTTLEQRIVTRKQTLVFVRYVVAFHLALYSPFSTVRILPHQKFNSPFFAPSVKGKIKFEQFQQLEKWNKFLQSVVIECKKMISLSNLFAVGGGKNTTTGNKPAVNRLSLHQGRRKH